ncbi:MAG: hypothetical protein ACR2PL_01765 [Dehalococcoidia bacterium]
MSGKSGALWATFIWRFLPGWMRSRIVYTQQLDTDLFIALPATTKYSFIDRAQRALEYPTFVETGTFLGNMSWHASRLFTQVHTIELDPELAMRATRRFAGVMNVTVHHGDSGSVLPALLETLDSPCVFWLDGHYSGGITARGYLDTPIVGELQAIADHHVRPHAVLIDDARVFGTDDAYPTLGEVIRLLRNIDPAFHVAVSSDIIWAAPVKLLNFEWRTAPSGVVVPPSTALEPAPQSTPVAASGLTARASR